MALPRWPAGLLLALALLRAASAQVSWGLTGALSLGASGQLLLRAGALSANVSTPAALAALPLQLGGAFRSAGGGSYALLAGASAAQAAATVLSVSFVDGSSAAAAAGAPGPLGALAAASAATLVGLSPGAAGAPPSVVQVAPAGGAALAALPLPAGCDAFGASAYDAARGVLHVVCAGPAVAGAQSLLSFLLLEGTLQRSVALPPSQALRVSALAVDAAGAVLTLGARSGAGLELGRVAPGAGGAYAGAAACAGRSPTGFEAYPAGVAATGLQGAAQLLVIGVAPRGAGGAERLRALDAGSGACLSDAPLQQGRLLDAFWVAAAAEPPPPPPGLSLAALQAQIDALRAAAQPPACAPGQLLQFSGGWRCVQLLSTAQPGALCRADATGAMACDAASLTPPTCLPPGGRSLGYTVAGGWECACEPGYSGVSCQTGSPGLGGACAPPACAPPAGTGAYRFSNVTGVYTCVCGAGYAGSPCVPVAAG